jgi:hypothetical protein
MEDAYDDFKSFTDMITGDAARRKALKSALDGDDDGGGKGKGKKKKKKK